MNPTTAPASEGKQANDPTAAQLQKEYQLLRELTGKLKKMGSRPPADGGATTEIRKTMEHLRAHLHRMFALEEKDGFLKVVLDKKPTMANEVDHLRDEHQRILRIVDKVYEQSALIKAGDAGWKDFSLRLKHCMSEIHHHDESESMLVMNVFGLDIGAGD